VKVPSSLPALISGDMTGLAAHWRRSGNFAQLPGHGMLHLQAPAAARWRLLISVGVHGNEVAPIEMLAPVLDALLQSPQSLQVDLFLVVGNPAALAVGKRFVDIDLNRLFSCPARVHEIGSRVAEAARADAIMRASAVFFKMESMPKWHLDLHSTIRPSLHTRFAVVPENPEQSAWQPHQPLIAWLGRAAMQAIVFNDLPATTFSAFTAREYSALSCTVELGQVGVSGANEMLPLLQTQQAIARLLRTKLPATGAAESSSAPAAAFGNPPVDGPLPVHYRVVQEIIKQGQDFHLNLASTAPNFTAIPAGCWIARDGATTISAGPLTEFAVFPNPEVQPGRRAALMVVRRAEEASVRQPQPAC